jgi:hypothetical protein
MKLRRIATLVFTLLALAFPAAAGVRSAPNEQRTPPASVTTPGKAPISARTPRGSRADESRYKARDAAAKNAKKFRGGEPVVVITATAAIIILLGVIIILLIT